MSQVLLPQELIEAIFDELRQDRDKRALKRCSLVCKAWLRPAYRRLFYDICLAWYRVPRVFDARSKSIAAPFIRRLQIPNDPAGVWNEIFPSLDGFHFITSLTLGNLLWDDILPDIRPIFLNRFSTITRLHLQNVITTTFSELTHMICTFHCLESLILGWTTWRVDDRAPSLLHLPRHLHALELDGERLIEILDWFCSFGQDLTLRNVCLMNPWGDHDEALDTLLQVLGPSLESFRIRLHGLDMPVCLYHNTLLRSLHLHVLRGHESETGLVSVLSGITSVCLEEISLTLVHAWDYSHDTFHDCVPMEWGEVDAILARPQFSNLKCISVCYTQDDFTGSPYVEYPLEWFFDRLPLCHKRGILRLCETETGKPFL